MNTLTPTRTVFFDRHFATKINTLDSEIEMLERRLPYERLRTPERAEKTAAKIRKLKGDRLHAITYKNR